MRSSAFEDYRTSPPRKVTLWRLFWGVVVIGLCWVAASVIVGVTSVLSGDDDPLAFFNSRLGTLLTLASFAGIWLGVWIATRFIHREPLGNVLGVSGRVHRGDFARGFIAVVLTSVLSEVLILMLDPTLSRTGVAPGTWLAFLLPAIVLCFVQTSAEEVLFRGYLPRNLANRFRSPWVWAVLPSLVFIAMHLSPGMSFPQMALVVVSIGILTMLMMYLVWRTGNLGAAFGVHMGNNLFAFTLIAHQDEFSGLALFRGVAVNDPSMSAGFAVTLIAVGIVCVGLTAVLLTHPRSPLAVSGGR